MALLLEHLVFINKPSYVVKWVMTVDRECLLVEIDIVMQSVRQYLGIFLFIVIFGVKWSYSENVSFQL